MKKYSTFLLGFLFSVSFAQAPAGYYDGTEGLTGYQLKTKLSTIISNGALDLGYSALWDTYKTSDVDNYYEKDGSVLDMYSEKPLTADAYEFSIGSDQCGSTNQNREGFCYNREHSLPKSFFGGQVAPMANDAHFVVPSDYYVNSQRGNYPYGETVAPVWVSTNGSEIGPSNFPGYSGTIFEPIDEFKGDFARMHLYFVTRYESKLTSFSDSQSDANPLDGTTDRGYKQWYINLLLKWAAQDPVSQKEIDRNNAIFARQKNRNPFIDHPEWVAMIWKSTLSSSEVSPAKKSISIYPNPVKNGELHLSGLGLNENSKVEIYSMDGKLVQSVEQNFKNSGTILLKNLTKGLYILKAGTQSLKFIVQ